MQVPEDADEPHDMATQLQELEDTLEQEVSGVDAGIEEMPFAEVAEKLGEALRMRQLYMQTSHQSFPAVTARHVHLDQHGLQSDHAVPMTSSGSEPKLPNGE